MRSCRCRWQWRAGRLIPLALLSLGGTAAGVAAQTAPHLDGRLTIDLDGGELAGDVCLTMLPVRDDSVTLVLNQALTIERITGVWSTAAASEVEPGGAAVRHTYLGASARTGKSGELVTDVCLEYRGRIPIHDVEAGEYREEDGSSVIAFNGSTVRARGVSRWHPTPYDPRTGLAAEALTFQMEIECARCVSIYVNGNGVLPGPVAMFASEVAREVLLVAGELQSAEFGGVSFVGHAVPPDSAEMFAATLLQISTFLEEYVGITYGAPPEVLTLNAVRAPRRGQLWGFFSDPALVLIRMSVSELVEAIERTGSPARRSVIGFLAHELAHRYFGWRLGVGSTQRDLFGEPFATFLELKAVRYFFGDGEYAQSADRLLRRASRGGPQPGLDVAIADDFARSSYRYGYSAAMLISLEQAIGEDAMRSTLAAMLSAPPEDRVFADYAFLAESVRRVGVPEEVWSDWERRCVLVEELGEECLGAVVQEI